MMDNETEARMVSNQAVHILLECFLVFDYFVQSGLFFVTARDMYVRGEFDYLERKRKYSSRGPGVSFRPSSGVLSHNHT